MAKKSAAYVFTAKLIGPSMVGKWPEDAQQYNLLFIIDKTLFYREVDGFLHESLLF